MENSYKNQITTLEESIQSMKTKTEEIEEKTAHLNEEYRLLMKKENELAEIEKERQAANSKPKEKKQS